MIEYLCITATMFYAECIYHSAKMETHRALYSFGAGSLVTVLLLALVFVGA